MSVYVIAEVGVNHNGDLERAKRMVEAAVLSGANAVKFQTFRAESLVTRSARKAEYQVRNDAHGGATQFEMLRRLELSFADFEVLKAVCEEVGIDFLSTPFDEECADFLAPLVRAFKVASGDLVTLPFLRHLGGKGKPIILSTGMATLGEVERAIETLREAGAPALTVLHCTSNYPCADFEVNLRAMSTLAAAFGVDVGYSDHTDGLEAAIAAVAMGAKVLEKHFTLDRSLAGPDHVASLTVEDLGRYVAAVRSTERMLGDGRKGPCRSELQTRTAARKSLVWLRDLEAGVVVTADMIGWKRPGTGLLTAELERLIGRRLARRVHEDSLVSLADLNFSEGLRAP